MKRGFSCFSDRILMESILSRELGVEGGTNPWHVLHASAKRRPFETRMMLAKAPPYPITPDRMVLQFWDCPPSPLSRD